MENKKSYLQKCVTNIKNSNNHNISQISTNNAKNTNLAKKNNSMGLPAGFGNINSKKMNQNNLMGNLQGVQKQLKVANNSNTLTSNLN